MNRILLETEELILEEKNVILTNILKSDITLQVFGNVNCGILNIPNNSNMIIRLHKNAVLNLDFFVNLKDVINKIEIYNEDNSKLNLNYSCTYEGENSLNIYNFINSNKTETNILVRAVEQNGKLEIKAEGCIYENTQSNVYLEDIKALTTNNNSIKIMPNLLVKTNSVIANHNATISDVQKPELFYLKSKGISENKAIELIKQGFLKGILKIDELKNGGDINNE